MPWALIANWPHPKRRRLLIVAALFFHAGRIASALYFAPRLVGQDAVTAALLGGVTARPKKKGTRVGCPSS
jgi:hypothetical protein